jgi:hypothetical protein
MRGFPSSELFVLVWDDLTSTAKVSGRLLRDGYFRMDLKTVRRWVKTFRELGIELRKSEDLLLPSSSKNVYSTGGEQSMS